MYCCMVKYIKIFVIGNMKIFSFVVTALMTDSVCLFSGEIQYLQLGIDKLSLDEINTPSTCLRKTTNYSDA